MRVHHTLVVLSFAALACNRAPPEPVGQPNPTEPSAQGTGTTNLTPPRVEVPPGEPPRELRTRDIVVGTGPEARAGQTVEVQYTGVAWSTRRQFDSSWERGARPFSFPLGQGRVIPGWDRGVVGMRVGGRRELIIPPDLAYGERGAPPNIGPNETLVFVVDLVAVH